MVFALDTTLRKFAVLSLAIGATAALAIPLWAHYRADSFSRQGTREALLAALKYEPSNAELHNRLGRVVLYSPLGDPEEALRELARATELDPHTASHWLDLALARELEGDLTGAGRALEAARTAEPRTPAVLWQMANFELRRNAPEATLAVLRELLSQSPEYTARALPVFARVFDLQTLLDRAVPASTESLGAALEYVRAESDFQGAPLVWERMMTLGQPLDPGRVRFFLTWLLVTGHAELGEKVWRDAATRGAIPVSRADAEQIFYNGDFTQPLLNYGLDWRVLPHPEASVWIEPGGPRPGQQSLCVRFREDARQPFEHMSHWIIVQPGHHYVMNAWLRSERLNSSPGAFLQIRGSQSDVPQNAATESVLGNSKWTEVMLRYETGPQSRMVNLALIRPGAGPQQQPAPGTVCVAAVSWKDLGPAGEVN